MGGPKGEREPKITRNKIAKLYGVHRNTVRLWLASGKLKGLTIEDVIEFDRKIRR